MGESLLINVMPGETRAALVEDGRVVELFIERKDRRSAVGNIYLGRVERILPGMDAAFVEIGLDRAGFLGIDGARPADAGRRDGERIADYLREGQAVRVQVSRDAIGRKGVQLTRLIALAGRCLVHTPLRDRVAVSRRIEAEDARERLRRMVADLARPGEGFIVRTAAAGLGEAELVRDADYLRLLWRDIESRQASASAPALLHEEPGPLLRLFRDRVGETTGEIRVDSPGGFAAARDFCETFMPAVAERLALHTGPRPIFEEDDVEAEIERALGARIDLPSGGEIVIETTEALTAIDVNSGRFTGAHRLEDTARAANLEAAGEIARQIRLRNIGGMVVIDFIHMAEEAHWRAVLDALAAAFAGDRDNVRIVGRTGAGLVELTRRRRRESLAQTMTETCPRCGGRGRVDSPDTIAHEVLRAMKREARAARAGGLVVTASGDVVDCLEAAGTGTLETLEASLGRRIRFDRDPHRAPGSFDIAVEDAAGPRTAGPG